MRYFLIDDIVDEDMTKLETWLKEQELQSLIEHLYHFKLPPKLLTALQKEHVPTCGPFYMALETGPDWIKLELLVRAKAILRCACIAYATQEQERYMISYLENLLQELHIPI
ncbi:MAG: hypothetical protein RBR42_10170 [Desulfomicrobium sp.]|nr:hypothetical protein [Desulfomicrobium sp.]